MHTPTLLTPWARRSTAALAGLSSAVLLLGACASLTPPPTQPMLSAQAAVTRAARAGAAETAPTELRSARDKLALAQVALADDKPKAAQRLAMEAQADANLAEAKARRAKAQKAAAALGEGNRVLREELQRVTP
jgi:hypothetical protein